MINKKYLSLFVLLFIIVMTLGAVSASDDVNDTDDAVLAVGDDDSLEDIQTDDVLSSSNDEDVLGDGEWNLRDVQSFIDGNESGSTIHFDRNISSFFGYQGVVINKEITIDGHGHSMITTANVPARYFIVNHTGVVLKNINFCGGNEIHYKSVEAGGAIYSNSTNLTIINCTFDSFYGIRGVYQGYKAENGGTIYFVGGNNGTSRPNSIHDR